MGILNPLDRYAYPDSEFSDEQWEAARERLITGLTDDGRTRAEAEERIDDWVIEEQCEADARDREANHADEMRARRKEGM